LKTYTFQIEVMREGGDWEATDPITIKAPSLVTAIVTLRTVKYPNLLSIPGNEGNSYRSVDFTVS